MIRKFNEEDRHTILDYAYGRERENLFVIGNLNRPTPFENAVYLGYFKGEALSGMATFFKIFGNLVLNFDDEHAAADLVDVARKQALPIRDVANFRRYAVPTLSHLKRHGIEPKTISEQSVMELQREHFIDFSKDVARQALPDDVDDIAKLHRLPDEPSNPDTQVTDHERRSIRPEETFVIRHNNMLVSTVNLHGTSKNYFQIGGVVTHPSHRGKGYAKQCVSALCRHCFLHGKTAGILFTANDNAAARHVYAALGFRPVDDFIIAHFETE